MNAIEVNNLTKIYRLYNSPKDRLREIISLNSKKFHHEFHALNDVSFNVEKGQTVGIIGQNGSGKSTLLQIICGVLQPTIGSVQVNGRIAALLELGTGFNPEFTGRDNVYMNGALMGFSRDAIERAMPEIEAFAEIGEYFDQPMRTYSSGMQMRVSFAIATAFRPEILIVDEALSVGDSYFQHKSFYRIRQFNEQGTALLFVTHGMGDVRALCDRVILLDKGRVIKDGQPDEVVDYYNALIAEKENAKLTVEQRRGKNGWLLTTSGTGEVRVTSLKLLDAATGQELAVARVGQKVELLCEASAYEDVPQLVLGYMIRDKRGHVIWGTNTWHTQQIQRGIHRGETVVYKFPFECTLGPGSYSVTTGLTVTDTHLNRNFEWSDNLLVFDVVNVDKPMFIGNVWLEGQFSIQKNR